MGKILEIDLIKTDKVWFIRDKSKEWNKPYKIKKLFFNGEKPSETFSDNWFQISKPKDEIIKVEEEISGERINKRYEIKDKEFISEKLPETIMYEDKEKYYDEDYEGYKILDNFYDFKYEVGENRRNPIEIKINEMLEIENFKMPVSFNYKGIHRANYSDEQYTISRKDINHQELDKIIFPEIMLQNRPCSLSSKQMYDITRQYIKDHIDLKVAKITSDYDFCFTVKKIVPLIEPETFTYQNIFGRTKREREKIHYATKEYKEIEIYQMTHKQENYKGYTAIEPLFANSEEELKEKIDEWLTATIKRINQPLELCPHCNGTGYKDGILKSK